MLVETLETATHVVDGWRALHARGRATALPAGTPRRLPRLAPLPDGRVAVLHRPRRAGRATTRPGSGGPPRRAASDAIVAAGGTITHHHAVGRDHAPWLAAEVGALGVGVLRAVKERCDPAGIMNPGKLLAP